MKAKKSNRCYSIEPREANHFQAQGYDIYDDDGKIVMYGAGKTVSIESYVALKKQNESLQEMIDKLTAKLEKQKGSNKGEK